MEENAQFVGPIEKITLSPHLQMEVNPVSKTVYFLVISDSERRIKSINPAILRPGT
jgi:hypothetical protein